ncbi:MAG: CCA tRNA nucleotidyltransferase [Alphaproteobacteria bacterium]|nr:MAG: CCA tRNA nucleotidyltransferase [Alphaproteobacteria bacterium]
MISPDTVRVMEALQADGGDARFVGGCVRDALVNRPVLDIDIATPLKPDEVIARLNAAKIKHAPTGLKHGTVTAIVDGHPFEITTLRIDVNPFGRHAEVAFTDDWEKDAARRDFTINAMSATMDGDVYDPFNGVEHLRTGRVVFVGEAEQRIREDILRILRFFRFYAHFGQGRPDMRALLACSRLAGEIVKLSAERIRQEIFKLLESDRSADVWNIMMHAGVVTHFLPEATAVPVLSRLIELEAARHHQGKAFVLRRLAALLDITQNCVPMVIKALKLSNDQAAQLATLATPTWKVSLRMSVKEVEQLVYRLDNDMVRSLLLLASARENTREHFDELYQAATAFRAPRFPLVGGDVLKIGWKEGPDVGRILGEISEWWMEQGFKPGRTECLAKLLENYPNNPDPKPAWLAKKE